MLVAITPIVRERCRVVVCGGFVVFLFCPAQARQDVVFRPQSLSRPQLPDVTFRGGEGIASGFDSQERQMTSEWLS